jgi:hypothetical protein
MSYKHLDPDEPGLDDRTRRRRRILAEMREMSTAEILAIAVRAGISTPDGQLTPNYRHDAPPSVCRPTD